MAAEVVTQDELIIGARNNVQHSEMFSWNYDSSLRFLLSIPSKRIMFGPIYETETSVGIPITIDTYIGKYDEFSSICIFFGSDSEGVPVGYRHTICHDTGRELCTYGYVINALKECGLGTVIEFAHQDMLYRIARMKGKRVIHKVTNINRNVLMNLLKDYGSFLTSGRSPFSNEGRKKQSEIDLSRQEQERWQAIFGSQGKFGYQPYLCDRYETSKTFRPSEGLRDSVPLEQIDTIRLERVTSTSSDGRILYFPRASDMWLGDRDEIRAYKYERLRSLPFLSDNHG